MTDDTRLFGGSGCRRAAADSTPSTAVLLEMLPIGGCLEVKRALCAHIVVASLVWALLFLRVRVKAIPATVVALAVGQIAMNMILIPNDLSFWSEFDSYVGLYGFVQIATPVVILVYAISCAISDRRASSTSAAPKRPPR